ncbi:2-isopropylmalate synthase [Rhodohalobacter sp. SW132]|uniref:2-isopropylmalate synthase n=1 Tax=Rhodohalobacter sp. SW132 TaxID=2293433 RepID=UPI000E26CA8E|nr:2-isopropylmalate synthase [Rhodohalobacter sp. SW132]REL33399.1 2-isopropylmalate synthase [Rhodohalobacter sp. SW132]
MSNQIKIFDTTLRDGEQSPGYSMNESEKLRLARQLEKLGVDIIEAGFPIASEGDFQTVKKIAEIITESSVAGLCRTTDLDIETAAKAVEKAAKPRIHTFIATSDIHMKYKLCKSRDEVVESTIHAVEKARSYCDDVEFSAEDASRSDPEFLYRVFEAAISAGATTINVPDTVGYALPWEFGELIKGIRENVPNISDAVLSVHCHNDLGLAVANSLFAVQNGAEQVECTINGIGERAGNASLEEIVMAIETRKNNMDFTTGVNTREIYPASQLLAEITGKGVQPNKAIVGDNAFAHEAGIHQHGVLKNPLCYEIMTPESVGLTCNKIVIGKHSGRFALGKKLEDMGYKLSKDELNSAYKSVTRLADEKKIVKDHDLTSIMSMMRNQPNPEPQKMASGG